MKDARELPCQHGAYLCSLCSHTRAIPTEFRIVRMGRTPRYVGVAWNYAAAVFVTTRDCATYTSARQALDERLRELGAVTRWFEGAYQIDERGSMSEMPSELRAEAEAVRS